MAGCPVHIWGPMMVAAVPFARSARDRVRLLFTRDRAASDAAPRELHRWAPIAPHAPTPEDASTR